MKMWDPILKNFFSFFLLFVFSRTVPRHMEVPGEEVRYSDVEIASHPTWTQLLLRFWFTQVQGDHLLEQARGEK